MESSEWIGWHFIQENKLTRYSKEPVEVGAALIESRPLELCNVGLHASRRAIDALAYAPGPIACRVRLEGEILEGHDKACASRRVVLAMADATKILHEFSCRCAEGVLRLAGSDRPTCERAIAAKRGWLAGTVSSGELAASREAAWAAARKAAGSSAVSAAVAAAGPAAWSAAGSAAWEASREAAWEASREAAGPAAWEAAREAAWAAQNRRLEQMLSDLMGH